MKKFHVLHIIFLLGIISCNHITEKDSSTNTQDNSSFPELSGPYLGQKTPDTIPLIFAPGIVGTGMFTRDMAITPGGDEIYYCIAVANYTYATILHSKLLDGYWTKPEVVPFSTDAKLFDFEPGFSPDGRRLYFLSTRPDGDEEQGDQDIWYVDRSKEGWEEPVNPGAPLNTDGGEFFPSLTRDGYIYFTHNDKGAALNQIFRSKITEGQFGEPELLPEQVNCGTNRFNAFVSPDHSYVIVPVMGMEDAYDQVDYYITFRNEEDKWSEPVNMGPQINKDNTRGWSPYVTPDGKYFFFMANWSKEIPAEEWNYQALTDLYAEPENGNSDIYWMKADFTKAMRSEAKW